LKGSDVQAIKTSMENLVQASHKLAEQVYAQASAAGGTPGSGEAEADSSSGEEEVIDADYEVMDEDKS
ncbi:MAG: molecular chaperone DnaK, partial [Actinobacteria bacterium]|nr:molecular chaperone DnaK [Actinomycetota bacterium]